MSAPPSVEKVTIVPGMSPFLQSQSDSYKVYEDKLDDDDGASASALSDGSNKYKHVIKEAETNVARLAGVVQNAELELEKAFRRNGDVQKGYTNKLESQTQELKRLVTSKQAQITYLEEKVGNMKKKYAEKLSDAQTRISTLEQELRQFKHSQLQERTKVGDKLKRELVPLKSSLQQLKNDKTRLEMQVEKLGQENSKLRKQRESSEDKKSTAAAANAQMDLQKLKAEAEQQAKLRQCMQQLALEKARSAKLQKKVIRLKQQVDEHVRSDRFKEMVDMKMPYKEQLKRENILLSQQLLSNRTPASKGQELDNAHMVWVQRALNSGEFNGSVCGNGWANEYKNLFYEM